jgi:hypothetical protein
MRTAVCLAVLALASPALAQEFRRLLPTNPANDTSWNTGINWVSRDGRYFGGYQNYDANTPHGAIWDRLSASARATLTTPPAAVRAMSDDASIYTGHTASNPSQTWWCDLSPGCRTLPTVRTVWACSPNGLTVIGNNVVGTETRVIIQHIDGPALVANNVASSLSIAISGDGTTAYYTAFGNGVYTIYRWVFATDPQPTSLGVSPYAPDSVCGVSDDGLVAYFSTPFSQNLRRYTVGVGFETNAGNTGYISSITPDGRRGVGKLGTGTSPGFIWDAFTGITMLSDIVPEIRDLANSPRISADGLTIAGAERLASGRVQAFWLRLPDSFNALQGDYSRDGSEDQDDVYEYVRYFAGAPNPFGLPLDYNRDGATDFTDVFDLVNCIAGGCP